jgi:hypothetical protein
LYIGEDERRICYQPTDKQGLIDTFIDHRRTQHLKPSPIFTFNTLRKFLEFGDIAIIENSPIPATLPKDIILLDERKDSTGNQLSIRLWDSEESPGYLKYSPPGEIKVSKAMSIQELARTLKAEVCICHFIQQLLHEARAY